MPLPGNIFFRRSGPAVVFQLVSLNISFPESPVAIATHYFCIAVLMVLLMTMMMLLGMVVWLSRRRRGTCQSIVAAYVAQPTLPKLCLTSVPQFATP